MAINTNGALSWINAFDAAVLAASSEAAGLPIGNLQSGHLVTKWRSDGDLSVWWTADFGAAFPIDIVGIFGANSTAAATLHIRLSSTDAHDGNLYDSGVVAMNRAVILRLRSQALLLLPSRVNARYLKIDLTDSGPAYLEAGIAWAGPLFQPARNFSYGQAPAVQDPSVTTPSVGGQEYTDLRPKRMTDTFTFALLTEAEAQQALDLDAAVGTASNVLWVRNPGQPDMNQNAILGRMTALAPAGSVTFNRRSRQFQIAERL
jgi:hypothetical protein